MNVKKVLCVALLFLAFGQLSAAGHRSPSPEGASVGFSNLSGGDVVPPVFIVKFTISGMGMAPAGSMPMPRGG